MHKLYVAATSPKYPFHIARERIKDIIDREREIFLLTKGPQSSQIADIRGEIKQLMSLLRDHLATLAHDKRYLSTIRLIMQNIFDQYCHDLKLATLDDPDLYLDAISNFFNYQIEPIRDRALEMGGKFFYGCWQESKNIDHMIYAIACFRNIETFSGEVLTLSRNAYSIALNQPFSYWTDLELALQQDTPRNKEIRETLLLTERKLEIYGSLGFTQPQRPQGPS